MSVGADNKCHSDDSRHLLVRNEKRKYHISKYLGGFNYRRALADRLLKSRSPTAGLGSAANKDFFRGD